MTKTPVPCDIHVSVCLTQASDDQFFTADPAADTFNYPASIDIRDLVTLEDVMEQLELGPNGCVALLSWETIHTYTEGNVWGWQ